MYNSLINNLVQGWIIHMNKNIEMMKKLIEEKKNKGLTKKNTKAQKNMSTGNHSKGFKVGNGGGLFDK